MRIGHGFDVHSFEAGNAIILGGVSIPFEHRFAAHSDGDVLIHALCDAMLGAAGLGDIGQHFPDTEEQYKNINSRILLRKVSVLINKMALSVGNIDITIVAQAPKLGPYLSAMIETLGHDLKLDKTRINIKATTTERLGYIGRGEGIAVHAVCILHHPS